MRNNRKNHLAPFLLIALLEHVVLTLFACLAIYKEPVIKIEESPIEIELLIEKPREKIIEIEPIPFVPQLQSNPIYDLPELRSSQDLSSFLSGSENSIGLPNLPRSTTFRSDNDRTILDATASRGKQTGMKDQEFSPTVKSRSTSEKIGFHSLDNPRGHDDLPRTTNSNGSGGRKIAGNLADGGSINSRVNRVSSGKGYRITGEVAGRKRVDDTSPPKIIGSFQGGIIRLSFKVRPNGTVFVTGVIEDRTGGLKSKARSYLSQFRFEKLPKNVKQSDQSGEIQIDFDRLN